MSAEFDRMAARFAARKTEPGVIYSPEDVAGLLRREFVVAVDLLVVFFLWVPVIVLCGLHVMSRSGAVACALLVAWAYLAWLKVTRFRTVGYRLAHVELVDLWGRRVTPWRSTLRFFFIFIGAANLIDLVMLSHDPSRQTLRDKLIGTYVIREGARPIGSGPIVYPTYFVAGFSFVFKEVARSDANARSEHRGDAG